MIEYITDKLHKFNTSKVWTIFEYVVTICIMLALCVLIFSVFFSAFSPLFASAVGYFPQTVILTNQSGVPYENIVVAFSSNADYSSTKTSFNDTANCNYPARGLDNEVQIFTVSNGYIDGLEFLQTNIPNGTYHAVFQAMAQGENIVFAPTYSPTYSGECYLADADTYFLFYVDNDTTANELMLAQYSAYEFQTASTIKLVPTDNTEPPTQCPTLEEQIADYDGSWYMFEQMLKANNYELWLKYSAELADVGSIQYSQGLTQGYQNGFMGALSGNNVQDPIDQYWNSTKEYVLIAGQPYFAPNGFGAIDAYNTIGIYGEHESKLHKQDGTIQVFNGQYVTEFASAGTLGGGWYKIGSTVGDEYAYEQSFNVSAMDKAYYVSRVSPLGDPVEEFLVAIWLDDYEAWYVAEEYVHYGTVANNDKSYKQVYSIYMTDIRPTAQRFINYDNPTLYENFDEDVNATLYLATFNQLNNYNVYTDGIGIVESYNNGFDAGANTTLWLDLLSQPIVAFFSIPLAQVIVEGVTYTLTYGIVLGAGIVALIVVWFLKLFAGG